MPQDFGDGGHNFSDRFWKCGLAHRARCWNNDRVTLLGCLLDVTGIVAGRGHVLQLRTQNLPHILPASFRGVMANLTQRFETAGIVKAVENLDDRVSCGNFKFRLMKPVPLL